MFPSSFQWGHRGDEEDHKLYGHQILLPGSHTNMATEGFCGWTTACHNRDTELLSILRYFPITAKIRSRHTTAEETKSWPWHVKELQVNLKSFILVQGSGKAAFNQLTTYMSDNNLFEPMQSTYRKYHSTETALVRVQNDLLWALDDHSAVVLVLLDLSAAFDTVNHPILVARLKHRLGHSDPVLLWFCSYLSGWQQRVLVGKERSEVRSVDCRVLKGLCLALWFSPSTLHQWGSPLHK